MSEEAQLIVAMMVQDLVREIRELRAEIREVAEGTRSGVGTTTQKLDQLEAAAGALLQD